MVYIRYKEMDTCITPFPEVSSKDEVAGGQLKKFPARLFAVPPRIAKGSIQGVTAESYQEDNKLWKKRLNVYKRINRLIGTTRYRNVMDMNAGLGGFAAALESPKSWVINVVPTIAKNTLGVIYERGLIGIYHDWYAPTNVSFFVVHLKSCRFSLHFYVMKLLRICSMAVLFAILTKMKTCYYITNFKAYLLMRPLCIKIYWYILRGIPSLGFPFVVIFDSISLHLQFIKHHMVLY